MALPQAGAGCTAFAECAEVLDPRASLWALNLPGRHARFREPPITALDRLVHGVTSGMGRHLDRPYVLFGYCSGALLAYLAAVAGRASGLPAPAALVVASYPAPHVAKPAPDLHLLPTEDFWRDILAQGGVPAALVAQPDHRQIFEPALRADYQVLSGYEFTPDEPLEVPILALAGRDDPMITESELTAWSERTTAGFELRYLPGDHWLLDHAFPQLAEVLAGVCQP